ncbi:glycosyltransferase family 2 protein, partial [uncultured Duncaniella sp.]
MPYISVIMPVYNAERFLDCSVGSVLSQTFDDWELICFNDASTDKSIDILNRYASSDKRIRVIDSPVNVKQGGGRNRGLLAAKGEYVMFLDADDRLASHESLATCIRAIKEENADMVLFDYETFRNDGSDPVTVSPLGQEAAELSGDNLRRHITMHPGPIWSAVYKRTLILENGLLFPEGVFYEDNAVALAIQLSASLPAKINASIYGYRTDNTSVTRSRNDYRFFHRINSAVTLKSHLVRLKLYDRWHDE